MPSVQPRAIEALIEQFESGHLPQDSELTLFSDLSRNEAATLRERWPRISLEVRERIIERAAELAEESVDLDFVSLGRIALDDAEPTVRLRGVEAVAESSSRSIAEKLRDIAAGDQSDEVRALASAALGQFVVAHELGRLESRFGDSIVATLRSSAEDPTADPDLRAAAIESLGSVSAEWLPDVISRAYESGERSVRLAALRAMGENADERWVDYVAGQFFSDDDEFRFEAAVAAGSIAAEEFVEDLGTLILGDSPEVQLAAIEALGEIGGQEAVDLLRDFIKVADDAFQEAAKLALENAVENSGGGLDLGDDDDDDEDDDE